SSKILQILGDLIRFSLCLLDAFSHRTDSVVGFGQIQVNIGSVRLAVQFLVGFGVVFWVSVSRLGPAGFS
ncbi:Hypothetical predicted protein, partial [Olea europaea subsp. europaea]